MLKPVVLLALVFTLAPSFAEAAKCPVINGVFGMDVDVGGKIQHLKLVKFTRQDGNKFSYSVDGNGKVFFPADGKPHPIQIRDIANMITIVCSGDSLSIVVVAENPDEAYRVHITKLSEDELDFRSNVENRSGIYSRL